MGSNRAVVEASEAHVLEFLEELSDTDLKTAESLGLVAESAIRNVYEHSLFAKTAIVGNKVAALWGVVGTCYEGIGMPWLQVAPWLNEGPFWVVSIFKKELKNMLKSFPMLVDFVRADDTRTQRLLQLLGFELGEKVNLGADGALHIRAEMR